MAQVLNPYSYNEYPPQRLPPVDSEQKLYHLDNLHVKTILKESHCTPVQQLVFNHVDEDKHNLFATVGGNQATIYDNNHFCSYVDVVSHFVNEKTEYAPGGELLTCCWLPSSDTNEEFGDALLAIGGKDNCVSVISSTKCRVVALLKGHTKAITALASSAARPGQVLSLSADGTMRLWDYHNEECLMVMDGGKDVSSVEILRDGESLITGMKNGTVRSWQLPPQAAEAGKRKRSEAAAVSLAAGSEKLALSEEHDRPVDCLRQLPDGRLATKSVDGRINIYDLETHERVLALKVPGCPPMSDSSSFGTTPGGDYLAAGNNSGEVFVFSTAASDGKRVACCKPHKVTTHVNAAAISGDCRQVLAVMGDGFIFRHEFIPPAAAEEEKGSGEPQEEEAAAADE